MNAKNESGLPAVLLALYRGHRSIAVLLVERGAELDIFAAAAVGDVSRVRNLVQQDGSLLCAFGADGFSALGLAAYLGHEAIVEFLLDSGADVNAVSQNQTGYTALTGAVAQSHTSIAALLIKRGANARYVYAQGFTPLMEAAANGHRELVALLLDSGADINARSQDGQTSLGYALAKGHLDIAGLLLIALVSRLAPGAALRHVVRPSAP